MVGSPSDVAGMPDGADARTDVGLRALNSIRLHGPFNGLDRLRKSVTFDASLVTFPTQHATNDSYPFA